MAKMKFYTEKISLAQSQSEIWKTLKHILPSKQTDNLETDLNASGFNSFLCSVGNNLMTNVPVTNVGTTDDLKLNINHNKSFKFDTVQTSFIEKSLSSLKSNSSLDVLDMDCKLLKVAAKQLAPSLSYLLNLSLKSGIIPQDFKLACITPIFKGKGDPADMGHYRPISIISHLSKFVKKL